MTNISYKTLEAWLLKANPYQETYLSACVNQTRESPYYSAEVQVAQIDQDNPVVRYWSYRDLIPEVAFAPGVSEEVRDTAVSLLAAVKTILENRNFVNIADAGVDIPNPSYGLTNLIRRRMVANTYKYEVA